MITIIITTRNRPDFLERLLKYYAEVKCQYKIIIGDSSDDAYLEVIEELVQKYKRQINVECHFYPGLIMGEAISAMIDLVDTPYVVFTADDDFLVPNGLKSCATFLNSNKDYVAAHGLGVVFSLKQAGPYGVVRGVNFYRQPLITAETASQRLLQHLTKYSVPLFAVHRVAVWKKMWSACKNIKEKSFSDELLPSCISVVMGKIAQVDNFYLLRQVHDRRNILLDAYDWITDEKWFSSYQIFANTLTNLMVTIDKITTDEALASLKKAFTPYLIHSMQQVKTGKDDIYNFTLRVFNRVCRWVNAWIRRRNYISLANLLKTSSKYHADFMPVYKILTKG